VLWCCVGDGTSYITGVLFCEGLTPVTTPVVDDFNYFFTFGFVFYRWGSWLKSFELTEELCVCTTREAERLELVICMVKNGDFDIFIGVCPLFYMLMDKSIRIMHGCLSLFFLFLMSRAATTTLAYHWVECICE